MLTKEVIQSVVNNKNLVVRNLQVTLGYYWLSNGMRKLISSKNVSWLGFATHASKTAGQALRHENLPPILKSAMIRRAGYENTLMYLDDLIEADGGFTKRNLNRIAEALNRVSRLVSAGNILVFKELAWPFTNLISTFSNAWNYDDAKLRSFLEEYLVPGPVEEDGQDYLIEAFTAFYKARFETKRKRKAEHILHDNLLVGLHEQTRLQPFIAEALTVPYDIFIDEEQHKEDFFPGDIGKLIPRWTSAAIRELVTRAATRMFMAFALPTRDLKLGQDIVAPTGVTASFPQDLVTIQDPYIRSLVQQFDRGFDTLSDSAANNWGSLQDRMSFVVDFFRSHQQYKRLFESPFTESQIAAIDAGVVPTGPL